MNDATIARIPQELLAFAVQADVTGWSVRDTLAAGGWPLYDQWLVQDRHLTLQRIRQLVDGFSTWQHQPLTGRRRTGEAVLLKAMLVRQLDNAKFRQLPPQFPRYLHPLFPTRDVAAAADSPGSSTARSRGGRPPTPHGQRVS